ncbi:MAG TPA: hypothetical protein VHT75_19295 [Acidimicrobiales bacterium]|jgi:hypothetical protein|nr:hypothetical protein [Acidimicrobiales bacterium]
MKSNRRKRTLVIGGLVTSIGAAATLLAGATFGFFSSAGVSSGSNRFTAGNVLVGLDPSGTQVTCAITAMSPGDSQASGTNAACRYVIKYTGNVNAFLALDLSITGTAGTPTTPYGASAPSAAQGLYDGSANGLQFNISDGTNTYLNGVQYNNQSGGPPTPLTPTSGAASVTDLLMNTTPVTAGATRTLTVNYNLPNTAGNAYNVATSTIVLTVHAVQADNNALPVGCVAGAVCSTGMNWS